MGTSTSSRGPSSNNPLVPAWADADGQGGVPADGTERFSGFRTSLGNFVATGDQGELRSALGKYAKTATGGRASGPRRYGSISKAGAALFQTLSSFRDGQNAAGLDLGTLAGQDIDLVIDAIVRALLPTDGDAERIRIAMIEALSECLTGMDEFDFTQITDDMIVNMMLAYTARCILGQILLDSRMAFARAPNSVREEQALEAMLALVRAAADKHMGPLLSGNIRTINEMQMQGVQQRAIREIWTEWEAYQP